MRPGLFRAKALERLSSPEQLDQAIRVTSPRSWLAFLGLAVVVVAAVVWGFVGSVPRTVAGEGILVEPGGILEVVTTAPGVVVEVPVRAGDVVQQGQVVAWLQGTANTPGGPDGGAAVGAAATPGGQRVPVTSLFGGRVVEFLVGQGNFIAVGDPVLTLEGLDDRITAYLYVPDGPGKQIEPGMEVRISPSTVDRSQYGAMIGRVEAVSEFPVTERGVMRLLENEALAGRFLDDGPMLEVVVRLVEDAGTTSGYRWSSPDGPPIALSPGTLADGEVVLEEQRPANLVLPGV